MSRDDLIRRGDALDAFNKSADPRGYIEKLIPPHQTAFSASENFSGNNVYSATVHIALMMDLLADDMESARRKAALIYNDRRVMMPEVSPDMVIIQHLYTIKPEEATREK